MSSSDTTFGSLRSLSHAWQHGLAQTERCPSVDTIILVHNHPSGDPAPSDADIRMTSEIKDAGAKLGIVLHDHVVIAKGGHISFKSMGLL